MQASEGIQHYLWHDNLLDHTPVRNSKECVGRTSRQTSLGASDITRLVGPGASLSNESTRAASSRPAAGTSRRPDEETRCLIDTHDKFNNTLHKKVRITSDAEVEEYILTLYSLHWQKISTSKILQMQVLHQEEVALGDSSVALRKYWKHSA